MTPTDFRVWRAKLNLTDKKAAALLGISKQSVRNYRRGHRPDCPGVSIPEPISKLCGLLEAMYDKGELKL